MCNYELLAVDEGVSNNDVIFQASEAIRQLGGDLSKYPYLLLTSQGSFLDDGEVPSGLRDELLQMFWTAGLRGISTESEARYCLDLERLRAIRRAFPGRISIGIGLEAANDFVRNSIINKGLPIRTFERAILSLREFDVGFYTYISLGKPFLTPQEDILDAVDAVHLSNKYGAFMSVIEMINIQPFTLTERLWKNSLYQPCNLWTGVNLLSRLAPEIRASVSIKGFDSDVSPIPLALPSACSRCDSRLRNALNQWNLHRDYQALLREVGSCECFDISEAPTDGLEERVAVALRALGD